MAKTLIEEVNIQTAYLKTGLDSKMNYFSLSACVYFLCAG